MTELILLPSACHDGIGNPDYIAYAAQYPACTPPLSTLRRHPREYLRMTWGSMWFATPIGVPEKGLALHIEAKWTECINGRDRPALPFGKLSETLPTAFTT